MSGDQQSEMEGTAEAAAEKPSEATSSRQKWASPLLRVSSSSSSCHLCAAGHQANQSIRNNNDVDGDDPTVVVTIPCDGYYCVSFGYARPIHCGPTNVGKKRKRGSKQQVGTTTTTSSTITTTNNSRDKNIDMAYLHIHYSQPNQQGQEKRVEVMRELPLPWREDDDKDDHAIEDASKERKNKKKSNRQKLASLSPSLYLGKLLWFDRQTKLRVVTSTTSGDSATMPQWQVRLQHEPKPGKTSSSTGTAHIPKKKWACSLCRKTFHSAFQVAQHQETTHYQQLMLQSSSNNNNNQHDDDDQGTTNKATSSTPSPLSSFWTTPLQVVYDDNFLAVVVKPQGMPIMGDVDGPTLQRSSLLMALIPPGAHPHHEGPKTKFPWPRRNDDESSSSNKRNNDMVEKREDGDSDDDDNNDDADADAEIMDTYLGKPRAVHRLDAPTGGLLVVAKTNRTDSLLRKAFMDRDCQKVYHALVHGNVAADAGECQQELGGKESLTRFRVLKRSRSFNSSSKDGWVSIVELYPHTGRQHQLRRHMQMMGHPIWGDRRYGPRIKNNVKDEDHSNGEKEVNDNENANATAASALKNKNFWQSRLCLWAIAITFTHPVTGKEISCRMDDPEWLQQVVAHEEAEWNCHHRGCHDNQDGE